MLTDNEIKQATEDALKFNALKETLKEIITESDTPLTIGLYGEWGTGKTSLMRMTKESLENIDKVIKTVWFDAWKFDKSHDLRVALIQSILREIEEDEAVKTDFREKVGKLRKRVNWRGLGLTAINQFLPRSMSFKELSDPLIKNPEDNSQKTLELIGDFEDEFREITEEYVGYQGGKLVIFIDDLDRCLPQNTIDILESIKLFLNVPNSLFIIGADKQVIESGIFQKYPEMYEDWGKKYLDKIIQIPFFLPPLKEDIIKNEFIRKLPIPDEIKQYNEIIAEVGGNPRTIKRLINQFELQRLLAKKQGTDVDNEIMAKICVIQFRQPEFHDTFVKMYVETEKNLVEKLRKFYKTTDVEKNKKLKEWKSFEKYFDDKKFIKFLFEEQPLLENIELGHYIYLVQSTSDFEDKTTDFVSISSSLLDEGDYIKALENLEKAIKIDPNDVMAWNNKAYALIQLNRLEDANICCNKVIEINPTDIFGLYNKAYILNEWGRFNEALEYYNKALDSNPEYVEAWVNKGFTLLNLGKSQEALESYDKALNLNPENDEAWVGKGNALNALDKSQEALESYDKAIALNTENENAWINKGDILSDLERSQEALESYEKAIGLDPDNVFLYLNKGDVLSDLGRSQEALKSYDKALDLDPGNENAWINKGNVLSDLGRSQEALEYYDKALDFDPDNVFLYLNKGDVLSNLGKLQEALKIYDKGLDLDPENEFIWFNKGHNYLKMGKYEDAINCFDEVLKIDPDLVYALNNKGDAFNKLHQYKKALKCIDRSIELEPENAIAWKIKGDTLKGLGKQQEAEAAYKKATQLEPDLEINE